MIYERICSCPPKVPRTEDEEKKYQETMVKKKTEVSAAFLAYLGLTDIFEDWVKNKESFMQVHGNNPITMWKSLLRTSIAELADFMLLLLGLSINQAGLEHNFSNLKIKKTRLQNHLKLPRLEKMVKVGADIRASHKRPDSLKNVLELLTIPRYTNLLEEGIGVSEDGGEESSLRAQSGLVKTHESWWKEMAKWVQKQ
ncbi:hypothetical protein CPB84DRAFT_1757297, partial [Gymnopilus junonius]